MSVLTRDLPLPIATGFHPAEANHTLIYHALIRQWPTGSGAASALLGSLCLGTFGTDTSFCQPGSLLSSVHAVSVHVAMHFPMAGDSGHQKYRRSEAVIGYKLFSFMMLHWGLLSEHQKG